MSGAALRMRPGIPADLDFLRRLHREAMRPHVERAWGAWDEEDQRRRFDATVEMEAAPDAPLPPGALG